MSRERRSLMRRLVAFMMLDEFMPIFPVYALLFADNGLSTSDISALLVLWSVVTFVLEVPSGAWADTVSRRLLLCISSICYGAAFATWMLFSEFAGFAAGFALWGLSSALSSGTFQALAYDELAAIGASDQYPRVMGRGTALTLVAMALATLLAAPLVALGGFALTGWVSVGVCVVQFLVARSLPVTPVVISAADVDDADELAEGAHAAAAYPAMGGFLRRYLHSLRAGVHEATRSRVVRGGVLASGLLMGLLAFDEYFGLMLAEQGSALAVIPLFLVVPTAGQALGGLLADRATQWSNAVIGGITIGAGVCIAGGALSHHTAGIVAVGLGYGALQMVVVSDVRLQNSISCGARATVTSVAGLLSEVVAVVVFAGFAMGSAFLSLTALVASLAALTVLLGPTVIGWMPRHLNAGD